MRVFLFLLALVFAYAMQFTVAYDETDENGDIVDDLDLGDDGDDNTGLLAQRIRGSLNAAAHQKALSQMEEQIKAALGEQAAAGITAVQQATNAFMSQQNDENEQALLLSIEQYARDQQLEGDATLIAQNLVSSIKQGTSAQICWACPACAIFAGPLSLAFPGLHLAMKGRCQSKGPISTTMRGQLACHFPTLNLNSVTVYWGCKYLNEDLFGRDIGMIPAGQTFGNDVFMNDPVKDNPSTVKTVMHELVHVKQYKDYGGDIAFGFKYLYHFCLKGFKYLKIDEEVAAYNFANSRSLCVTRSPTAPTTRAPTRAPTKKANGAFCNTDTECVSGNCAEFQLLKVTVKKCAAS